MAFLVGGANTLDDAALSIANSCRFFSNTDLKRLPSSTGSSLRGTLSVWVKFATDNTEMAIIGGWDNSGANDDDGYMVFKRLSTGELQFNGGTDVYLKTTAKFRDVSAWYHIVLAIDSAQNDNNAQRIYVNGTEITDFATRNNLTNLQDLPMNTTAGNDDALLIGCDEDTGGKGLHFNGYMSEFFWIDSTQYAASNFGETNDNGVWIPKKGSTIVCNLTMGTNGVYLEFKETGTSANSSGIGADTGGNNLHFTVTNLTAQDITTDTPTNNFATFNPLTLKNNPGAYYITFSEGNLKIAGNSATNNGNGHSTMGFNRGKWYYEVKIIDVQGDVYPTPGVVPENLINHGDVGSSGQIGYNGTDTVGYGSDGDKVINDSGTSYGNTYTDNDIIGIAIDCDNGAVYFSKNGTFQNSGDPTSGSSKTNAAMTFTPSKYYFLGCSVYQSTSIVEANFGNPPFSISSGNADANGYVNFEHAVPSGYYSLCTKNLAEFG